MVAESGAGTDVMRMMEVFTELGANDPHFAYQAQADMERCAVYQVEELEKSRLYVVIHT